MKKGAIRAGLFMAAWLLIPACGGGGGSGLPIGPSIPFQFPASHVPGDTFSTLSPDTSPATTTIMLTSDTTGGTVQTQLNAALQTSGKVVIDSGGVAHKLTLTATLNTADNVTLILDGKGTVTLDGGSAIRILRKGYRVNLTVQNLAFANALVGDDGTIDGSSGGAINVDTWDGYLTVIRSSFTNCQANSPGPDRGGGAIRAIGQRHTQLSECTFTNCQGSNGGAVSSLGSQLTIINCTFTGNAAIGKGGGTNAAPGGGVGGAVYMDGVSLNADVPRLAVSGCTFSGNTANSQAGAIFGLTYPGTGSTTIVDATTFSGNSVLVASPPGLQTAGAMYSQDNTLTIVDSTFNNNTAPQQGGGLWVSSSDGLLLANNTFFNNSAGQFGGATTLYSGMISMVNCTLVSNSAGNWGGAIFAIGSPGTVTNSLFSNNTGTDPNNGNVSDTTFSDGGGNFQWPILTGGADRLVAAGAKRVSILLGVLAANGGPTQTIAVPAGSAAQGAGVWTGAVPLFDQRGHARPTPPAPPDSGAYQSP